MYNFGPGLHQPGELFDILSTAGYITDASGHVLGKMTLGEYMAVLGRFLTVSVHHLKHPEKLASSGFIVQGFITPGCIC